MWEAQQDPSATLPRHYYLAVELGVTDEAGEDLGAGLGSDGHHARGTFIHRSGEFGSP
jgi:hypothetical protein